MAKKSDLGIGKVKLVPGNLPPSHDERQIDIHAPAPKFDTKVKKGMTNQITKINNDPYVLQKIGKRVV